MDMDKRLREWFDRELNKRGWSIRELGRQTGIAHSDLSDMLNSGKPLTLKLFVETSRVFGVSIDWLVQTEGLLPAITDTKAYSQLTPEKKQLVIEFAEFLLQKQSQEKPQSE